MKFFATLLLTTGMFCAKSYCQNVGIGTTNPLERLHVNGVVRSNGLQLMGINALETGIGIVGKETNAGKIGYGLFTPNTLDIVGAGTAASTRRIKLWAEGGTSFEGPITTNANANISGFTKLGEISKPIKTATFVVPVTKFVNNVGASWGGASLEIPISPKNMLSHYAISSLTNSYGNTASYPISGDHYNEIGKGGYVIGNLGAGGNVSVRYDDCDLCDKNAVFILHVTYTDTPVF